jgi:hypothetical protein
MKKIWIRKNWKNFTQANNYKVLQSILELVQQKNKSYNRKNTGKPFLFQDLDLRFFNFFVFKELWIRIRIRIRFFWIQDPAKTFGFFFGFRFGFRSATTVSMYRYKKHLPDA